MDGQSHGKHTENDIGLPVDVTECGWHEHGKGKVESPVDSGGERRTLGTLHVVEDLRAVDPDTDTPCGGEGAHKQVGSGDDTTSGGLVGVWNGDTHGVVTVKAVGLWHGVGGEQAGHDEQPDEHEDTTGDQHGTTAGLVDEEQGGDGHDDVQHVLDGARKQHGVTSGAGHLENVHDVVHHDVHTAQLLPHLSGKTHDGLGEGFFAEQVLVAEVEGDLVDDDLFADFLELELDLWVVEVAVGADARHHLAGLLPAVVVGEPTGRLGQEEGGEQQHEAGHHLDAPGDAEGRGAVDEVAAVADEKQNHDTDGDAELEQAADEATDLGRRHLGAVHGRGRGPEPDAQPADHTAHDQHGAVLRRALQNRADDPERRAHVQRHTPSERVSDAGRHKRPEERPPGHGRRDTTLRDGVWSVEVVFVVVCSDHGRHGRDVEPEHQTGDTRHDADDVHVVDLGKPVVERAAVLHVAEQKFIFERHGMWKSN